jgi:hypothetical protein
VEQQLPGQPDEWQRHVILDGAGGKLTFDAGGSALVYCTDFFHPAAGEEKYCLDQDFFADWRVAWFVTNYPPLEDANSYNEQAARQAIVWWLTDGYGLQADPTNGDSATDTAFINRYNAIKASIPANPPPEYVPGNVELQIDRRWRPMCSPISLAILQGAAEQGWRSAGRRADFGAGERRFAEQQHRYDQCEW